MFRFGLPSFKVLVAGAVAALAFAYHKGVLFDPAESGAKKPRPAASAAMPRQAKPVPTRKIAAPPRKAGDAKRDVASRMPARGVEMPRPKPLLTGSVGKQGTPRPPAGIPAAAGGQVGAKR